jgi:hypothetical protein
VFLAATTDGTSVTTPSSATAGTVIVLGGRGGRLDQEIASFSSLFRWVPSFHRIVLLDLYGCSFLLQPGVRHRIRWLGDGACCGSVLGRANNSSSNDNNNSNNNNNNNAYCSGDSMDPDATYLAMGGATPTAAAAAAVGTVGEAEGAEGRKERGRGGLVAGERGVYSSSSSSRRSCAVVVEGKSCGLLPIGGKVRSITTTGLQWDLNGDCLEMGQLVSSSNRGCDSPSHGGGSGGSGGGDGGGSGGDISGNGSDSKDSGLGPGGGSLADIVSNTAIKSASAASVREVTVVTSDCVLWTHSVDYSYVH